MSARSPALTHTNHHAAVQVAPQLLYSVIVTLIHTEHHHVCLHLMCLNNESAIVTHSHQTAQTHTINLHNHCGEIRNAADTNKHIDDENIPFIIHDLTSFPSTYVWCVFFPMCNENDNVNEM